MLNPHTPGAEALAMAGAALLILAIAQAAIGGPWVAIAGLAIVGIAILVTGLALLHRGPVGSGGAKGSERGAVSGSAKKVEKS